jgi:transposase
MAVHIDTASMASPRHYSSQVLNHLGLVAGMYDELGLGELLDQVLVQDEDSRIVSLGQAVKAMVLNGLGFTQRALYLTPLFFQDKPVERLLGAGIAAEHLNDDVLGRALDQIYAYGPTRLYAQLAARAVQRLGLDCRFGHLDASSFHVDGQYNSALKEEAADVIHITRGYSRDHRPELNQVVLQLLCERQAGIPLLMEALSGNSSDKSAFRETIRLYLGQLQGDVGLEVLIADSALYTRETLQEMSAHAWISRVPETLTLARELIHAVTAEIMHEPTQEAWCTLGTVYGEVRQRWVVVYSPQARQRAMNSVNKHCLKQGHAELKGFERLCNTDFACEADALKALARFESTLKIGMLGETGIEALPRFKGKGRPAKGRAPDFHVYRITGALASRVQERQRRLERKSCFILATNQLDESLLSDEDLIAAYKNQQKVERGFRFLKDPMFMAATLYLKKPERIMALMMVMTLCLLVYAALEQRIRETLKAEQESVPDQTGKPTARPTARWVFQFFKGIHVLVVEHVEQIVLNVEQHHSVLLQLLGPRYVAIYSANG